MAQIASLIGTRETTATWKRLHRSLNDEEVGTVDTTEMGRGANVERSLNRGVQSRPALHRGVENRTP
jgi:hypothetical protein